MVVIMTPFHGRESRTIHAQLAIRCRISGLTPMARYLSARVEHASATPPEPEPQAPDMTVTATAYEINGDPLKLDTQFTRLVNVDVIFATPPIPTAVDVFMMEPIAFWAPTTRVSILSLIFFQNRI